MQNRAVKAFKGRLKGYRYWQDRLKGQSELMQMCYDLLGASPKSPRFDDVPAHGPKDLDREYRIRTEIERIEPLLARAKDEVGYMDEILGKIETPLREAVIAIYADEKQLRSMADKLGYSKSGLERKINQAIEKALN